MGLPSLSILDVCCPNQALPQGAPTSPALSNIVVYPLDGRLFGFACKNNLRYTRYADDLTFSGEKIGQDTIEYVYRVLRDFKFEPNSKMTRLLRRSQRQIVTGLVVNEKLQAPREVRRKLRQHAYFIKKFGIEDHAAFTEITNAHFKEHLLGCAGFVKSVNANDRDAIALIDALKNLES